MYLLMLLLASGLSQQACASWSVVHSQTAAAAGTVHQPSIRYGHAVDRHGDRMLMTLGYYYDRDANSATWMSDTWEMDMQPPYAWHRIDAGISQEQAYSAYSSGSPPRAPTGRFGHTSAVHNDTLYVYGGHDGGISRHGRQNYEPGYDFDELWAFSIPKRTWRLLPARAATSAQPTGPGKRYLHASALIGDRLVLYGGLADGQGDVWAFNIRAGTWDRLSEEVPRDDQAPGRRVGHSLTAVDQPYSGSTSGRLQGALLVGGRYIVGTQTALDPSIHFFDLDTRTWRAVPAAVSGSAAPPAGRKYHGEASAWLALAADGSFAESSSTSSGSGTYVHATLIFGGTLTTPGLTCTAEAWLLTLDCGGTQAYWQRLPDLTTAIYDTRGAMSAAGTVFSYGGHLCAESKDVLPFFYTNAVHKLDLSRTNIKVPKGACRVPAQQLPQQRGQGKAAMDLQEHEL